MAIQFLRGSTASNLEYTGPVGSFTIDTQTWEVRIHDGVTAGGHVVGKTLEIPEATTSASGLMSAADKTKLNGIEEGAEKNTVSPADLTTKAPIDNPTLTGTVTIDEGEMSSGE